MIEPCSDPPQECRGSPRSGLRGVLDRVLMTRSSQTTQASSWRPRDKATWSPKSRPQLRLVGRRCADTQLEGHGGRARGPDVSQEDDSGADAHLENETETPATKTERRRMIEQTVWFNYRGRSAAHAFAPASPTSRCGHALASRQQGEPQSRPANACRLCIREIEQDRRRVEQYDDRETEARRYLRTLSAWLGATRPVLRQLPRLPRPLVEAMDALFDGLDEWVRTGCSEPHDRATSAARRAVEQWKAASRASPGRSPVDRPETSRRPSPPERSARRGPSPEPDSRSR